MNLWKAIEKLKSQYHLGMEINVDKFERKLIYLKKQNDIRLAGQSLDIKDLLKEGMDILALFKDRNGTTHNIFFHGLNFDYSKYSKLKQKFYKRLIVNVKKVSIDGVPYAIKVR